MPEYPEAARREIRKIRDRAYEIELSEALGELESGFSDWRKGHIDCFQLTDLVHGFHQGPQRRLYNYYANVKVPTAAAYAIASGLVPRDEVPPVVLEALDRDIRIQQELRRDRE